ncbi:MAG: hypothetical protein ACRD4Y_18640, partial [Candidatus Acidiferrales bacterium]
MIRTPVLRRISDQVSLTEEDVPMWGDKKSETPQPTTAKAPATPAPVARPASAPTEGKAMSTDAMRPL